MRFSITNIAAIAALSLVAACATTSEYVAPLPVEARITNNLGKTISRIDYQSCDNSAGGWSQLAVGEIAPGGTVTVQLPAPCVNMNAYNSDGRLVGSQTGVKREFPFTWTLS